MFSLRTQITCKRSSIAETNNNYEVEIMIRVSARDQKGFNNGFVEYVLREKMQSKKKLAAPCGLYCGVCGVYIAHSARDWRVFMA